MLGVSFRLQGSNVENMHEQSLPFKATTFLFHPEVGKPGKTTMLIGVKRWESEVRGIGEL